MRGTTFRKLNIKRLNYGFECAAISHSRCHAILYLLLFMYYVQYSLENVKKAEQNAAISFFVITFRNFRNTSPAFPPESGTNSKMSLKNSFGLYVWNMNEAIRKYILNVQLNGAWFFSFLRTAFVCEYIHTLYIRASRYCYVYSMY